MTRRLQGAAAALVTLCFAATAIAQTGRAAGIVRDTNGRPIRGAIVRATNATAHPGEITASTDDKGRWAVIGLTSAEWKFTVEAPGFLPQSAAVPVRIAGTPPLTFTLARDPGPLPGALDKNIQQQITEANSLREQGRLDQAIAAYDEIRAKNPKLTAVNLVLGDVYRERAAQERDPAARQTLLARALGAYTEVLKSDAQNERAKTGADSTRSEISAGNTQNR